MLLTPNESKDLREFILLICIMDTVLGLDILHALCTKFTALQKCPNRVIVLLLRYCATTLNPISNVVAFLNGEGNKYSPNI